MWWNKKKSPTVQRASSGAKSSASPMIMFLEPRMLFDGAVAATVADTAQADSAATAEAAKATDHAAAKDSSDSSHAQSAATADVTTTPAAVPGTTVVFVDSRVKDADSLLTGVAPGAQVVMLDATRDGLQQIADYLDSHQGVSSVQIIAHGNSGDLWLGNSYLSADNIAQRSALLAEIGNDMAEGGDILIYACNTAEGDQGLSFIDSLAGLTGRDIAASTNRTGVGGDWDLEIATGSIESVSALSRQAMDSYQWGLATFTVTSTANTGVGSLREALTNAQNGDIVTFNSNMTVLLTSQLQVTRNITIDGDLNNDGVADVTLDGQYRTSVIRVNSGVTTTFDGLVITRGLIAGGGANGGSSASDSMGAGISNAGNLTLLNVTVTSNAASGGGGGGGAIGGYYGGGGGGGGALGGQNGGSAGRVGVQGAPYSGTAPSANTGGNGGAFSTVYFGGRGGSSTGGAGGIGNTFGYSDGGAGRTANNGTISIGGGGGGAGWNTRGGDGGSAVGGVYNASSGVLTIVGTTSITNNLGAGGGGGGGNAAGGGEGGQGVGGIWSKGTVLITASNFAIMSGNVGASGAGGLALNGGPTGVSPTAVNSILNDGGTLNTSFSADTTAPTVSSIVIANPSLSSGSTSTVTFTFSEPVFGLDISEVVVPNGTLTNLVTTNNITWTATLTAAGNISDSSNAITLAGSAVRDSSGNIGTGTGTSNNYTVSDTTPPTATIVVADNALAVGETSLVTITFSEAVTGFTNADLTVGSGTLSPVSSSDGGTTWTATFTPTANLTSNTNQITLNRAGVQDLSGNAGVGTTTSNNYAIDTARPTATIVVSDTVLSIGDTALVTITFSEAVTGFNNADLTVANGSLSSMTTSNNIVWTGMFTPINNITDATNLITLDNTGVTDAAGNTGAGTTDSNNYAIDTQRPTATIVLADTALSVGETSLVTITFSEAVTGFTNADLIVPNGTLSPVSSSDGGTTWTATYTPNINVVDNTNIISLSNSGITDLAGNVGTGTTNSGNFTIDTTQPTATIVVADSALTIGETSLVTITFSEAVTGFTNADLTVENGTLSAVSSSDGGITWTATFTPTTGITDSSNLITLDNTGFANISGNTGSGTTVSNNYAIDTLRPTATIVVADNALAIGETSLVTITFSEAVSGFSNADLTVENGTLSAVSSSDGGITWTTTFTPVTGVTDTSNVISLNNSGFTDLAGNAGQGTTTSNNYVVDTVRPTATIVVADNALSIGETSLVTITFSEAVTGFTNADLTVPNGTLSTVSSSDGGITWTATYTPNINVADSTNLIILNNTGVADLAGNTGTGTTSSGNFTIDTIQPTATIVVADSALAIGETSLVTITFSEAVTGFTNADLAVENGTLSAVSSSDGGVTWTATFTPTTGIADSSNLITLDNTGFANISGNTGSGTTVSNNYAIDTLRPTATIVVADNALAIGETSLVTITFSEAVSGFTNADLTIANGTLSAVSSSDGGITWTATLTPTASLSDTSNVISLDNSGVIDLAGNAGQGVTTSNNYAIDTLRPTATIVMSDTVLSVGETSQVTITFSEAVSGFTNADLTVANGTLSALSSSDGGITWTATLTPTAGVNAASNAIILDTSGVSDAAGNAGSGTSTSGNYVIDSTRPTSSIVIANPNLGIGQTTQVTFTFSEPVTNFDLSDLSVANGTLSNLVTNDGGQTWTATLTPTANISDASNFIVMDSSNVTDLAGNAGTGVANSGNYSIDGTRPTVSSIVLANPNLTTGQTSQVTFTFSERVSNFDLSNLSVANGTLSNLVTSDGGQTWTATLTPNANTNDPSNFITLDSSTVTDLAGNTGVGIVNSANYAVTTQSQGGDPQFRIADSVPLISQPNLPLQPQLFGPPTGNLGSPLSFAPLFEQRTTGGDLPPVGNIFITNGALAPSFIAQVFTSTSVNGVGSGAGFLGFGNGEGSVFGNSTFSTLFSRESATGTSTTGSFDNAGGRGLSDSSQGIRNGFGALTLDQQLQQLKDSEQKQLHELAWALGKAGISEVQA